MGSRLREEHIETIARAAVVPRVGERRWLVFRAAAIWQGFKCLRRERTRVWQSHAPYGEEGQ